VGDRESQRILGVVGQTEFRGLNMKSSFLAGRGKTDGAESEVRVPHAPDEHVVIIHRLRVSRKGAGQRSFDGLNGFTGC